MVTICKLYSRKQFIPSSGQGHSTRTFLMKYLSNIHPFGDNGGMLGDKFYLFQKTDNSFDVSVLLRIATYQHLGVVTHPLPPLTLYPQSRVCRIKNWKVYINHITVDKGSFVFFLQFPISKDITDALHRHLIQSRLHYTHKSV